MSHPEHDSSTYRYCTNFAVTGDGLQAQRFVGLLEAIGDSVLCVGDEHTLKIHVHTDDPATATAVFEGVGEVSRLDVADMDSQVIERDARLAGRATARGAQRTGRAGRRLGDRPRRPVQRSRRPARWTAVPTMNPSTYDLLAGIHGVAAEEVVVLPNSPNVIMAAERAAELSDKTVRVLPVQHDAGRAWLRRSRFCRARTPPLNARVMLAAAESIRTAAVAPAARQDPAGRYGIGDAVGFVDDELVAWGGRRETLQQVLARAGRRR